MVSRSFVPDAGDLVWLTFNPQSGREEFGRRPALVLSPAVYNSRSNLALLCPITSRAKGYPFEVSLPAGLPVAGVVLSDQIRSLDWKTRKARFIATASREVLDEVRSRVAPLIGY